MKVMNAPKPMATTVPSAEPKNELQKFIHNNTIRIYFDGTKYGRRGQPFAIPLDVRAIFFDEPKKPLSPEKKKRLYANLPAHFFVRP